MPLRQCDKFDLELSKQFRQLSEAIDNRCAELGEQVEVFQGTLTTSMNIGEVSLCG